MNRTRKMCLMGALLLSLYTNTAGAAEYHFQDTAQIPWAAPSIEKLYEEGIVNGVSATAFAPNDPLTRAQFAAMVAKTQNDSYLEREMNFTDVAPGQWYFQSVKKMYSLGMIKGVSNTRFEPDRWITREEAAALFARTFDYPYNDMDLPFKDQGEIDSWAMDSVKKGTEKGLFGIFSDQFRPQQAITRAEAAVLIHKIFYGEPESYDPPKQLAPPPKIVPEQTQGSIQAPTLTEASLPAITPSVLASRSSDLKQQRLTKVVQSVVGVPYKYGGNSLEGMDCSGLTSYVYKQLGVDLPRESQNQFTVGTLVSVNNMQKGDLIFFDTGGGGISHVGIYMGDNQMAHAATNKAQVMISDLSWYFNHYKVVGVKRILS
ncbi:MAG TPA: S-layer homology domain-containing protein [Bacillota bacterium]|nr:S-layer homology domain-containing protein [Bacillota bacterium]